MTLSKTVLFCDRDLLLDKPFHHGQVPVHVARSATGPGQEFFSSGRLELALRRKLRAFVTSLLPEPRPEHEWFQKLLPSSSLFFSDGLLDLSAGPDVLLERIMAPWKKLYAKLGTPWPEGLDSPVPAKRILIERGVIDGAKLDGFGSN